MLYDWFENLANDYSDNIPFLLLLQLLLLPLLLLLTFILIVIIIILFFFSRNFDFLIPDAPELVHTFLEQEQDASCKRNAFMMLIHVDQVIGQYSGVSYKAYISFLMWLWSVPCCMNHLRKDQDKKNPNALIFLLLLACILLLQVKWVCLYITCTYAVSSYFMVTYPFYQVTFNLKLPLPPSLKKPFMERSWF